MRKNRGQMRREEIIREVSVYTVLFDPQIKRFRMVDNSRDKIEDINIPSNRIFSSNVRI